MGAVFAVTRQGGAGEPLSESDAWAIKAPLRRIYEDPARRARLLAEARVCATIFHTGLVQVLDWGTFDGDWPFIVMERMRGRTLRQVLDQGTPPIDTALAWLRDLACTLEMLHGLALAIDLDATVRHDGATDRRQITPGQKATEENNHHEHHRPNQPGRFAAIVVRNADHHQASAAG